MIARLASLIARRPTLKKLMWRLWYQYLARRYRDRSWLFMNYGYAPPRDAAPLMLADADEADRYSIQLYAHVAGAVDLGERQVLEVGSGRGGGASFVKRYLGPREVVGADLSANAVAFCRAQLPVPGLSFAVGDAEQLPFADGAFDVVLNVESSHCYASVPAFLAQVHRVLRPGGHFLYADFRGRQDLDTWRAQLEACGLALRSETDISANVVAALDQDNDRRLRLIEAIVPAALLPTFRQFAGVRGSILFDELRGGQTVYKSFVLQKPVADR